MNKNIKHVFHKLLASQITITEFEQWLYEDEEIEHVIGSGDYTSLISINFDDKFAPDYVYRIIDKHVPFVEYEKYRLTTLLHEIIINDEKSKDAIAETYYLYCNGYRFFEHLGLHYGLDLVVPECATQTLENMYPKIIVEAEKVLASLHNDKIVFKDELNDFNLCKYDDFR